MRKEHVAGKPAFSSVLRALSLACLAAMSCTTRHEPAVDAGPPACATPALFSGAIPLPFTAAAEWNLGDVNGDGIDDIAIANLAVLTGPDRTGCPLTVALGAADGGFVPEALRYAPEPACFGDIEYPLKVWVRDANGDGHPDLVILAASFFDVWYGRGDGWFGGDAGGFQLDEFLLGGIAGEALAQDGVTGDFGVGSVQVVLDAMVDGGEQFLIFTRGVDPRYDYPDRIDLDSCTHLANTLASGDFNGDGIEDIARVNCQGDLELFPGGALSHPAVYANRGAPSIGLLAAGSLFGDAGLDVVVGLADHLELYAGREDGGFADRGNIGSGVPRGGYRYGSIAIADWNDDGLADVAASVVGGDGGDTSIVFFFRTADGGFADPVSTACTPAVSVLGVKRSATAPPDMIVQPYLQSEEPRLFVR